ncbi:hypothetical protein [Streptomyces solincola]|uniref:hypothetical protein n=1 Tax=Streptomyces solincola TaxID=2100817 RepID=UPI0015E35781|nr:hypothetical protein [Streptomyces solincola]
MATWDVYLHGHVHQRVTVEAETEVEAWTAAQIAVLKKKPVRPPEWTPVMVHKRKG